MAAMASALEDNLKTVVAEYKMSRPTVSHHIWMLRVLGESLLLPPSIEIERAVCFSLYPERTSDKHAVLHEDKAVMNRPRSILDEVCHSVRRFLAVRFDLPEYMGAGWRIFQATYWSIGGLDNIDEDVEETWLSNIGSAESDSASASESLLFPFSNPNLWRIRTYERKRVAVCIEELDREESPRGKVVQDAADRLDESYVSLLGMSIVFRSWKACQVLIDALHHAFARKAPDVFKHLMNHLKSIPQELWSRGLMSANMKHLLRYMTNKIKMEGSEAAFEGMVTTHKSLITREGDPVSGDMSPRGLPWRL